MMDATEEMLNLLMNGFITTISLTRPAHLIKHLAMIMVLDVQLKLNVEIASPIKDVGLKKKHQFMVLMNSVPLLENKT